MHPIIYTVFPSQAVQIMVGLLNIGLGAILCSSHGGFSWPMNEVYFPFWLGGLVSKQILFFLYALKCQNQDATEYSAQNLHLY